MTTTKGLATRERILSTAADLMHHHGVAGAGMPLVRERAGVSSSQIYHYFADKDALVDAVIEHQVTTVVGGQDAALAQVDTPAALWAWRDALVAAAGTAPGQHGCPIGGLAAELTDEREDARRRLARAFDAWESSIRAGLERLEGSGDLAPGVDPATAAAALLAAVQGGLLLAQTRRDASGLAAALDAILASTLADPQRP